MLTAAVEELKACGEGGGRIAGFPLMKLKVTILGGEAHDRTTRTRRPSASPPTTPSTRPWRHGGPVLLEPIMRLDITTPEDYLGDFVGDLQQRRAMIARTEIRGPHDR